MNVIVQVSCAKYLKYEFTAEKQPLLLLFYSLILPSTLHFNWPQCMWGKVVRMHSQYVALSHSCLLSCPGWLGWLGLGSLLACLPACLCVFMSCSCTTTTSLLLPSSEGYEKSRSLNNIAGIAGNTLRVSPVTTPYGSPCPLRRSRSPIPSILWDVQLWATPLETTSILYYYHCELLILWCVDQSLLEIDQIWKKG